VSRAALYSDTSSHISSWLRRALWKKLSKLTAYAMAQDAAAAYATTDETAGQILFDDFYARREFSLREMPAFK
jgi:hypothetical protein